MPKSKKKTPTRIGKGKFRRTRKKLRGGADVLPINFNMKQIFQMKEKAPRLTGLGYSIGRKEAKITREASLSSTGNLTKLTLDISNFIDDNGEVIDTINSAKDKNITETVDVPLFKASDTDKISLTLKGNLYIELDKKEDKIEELAKVTAKRIIERIVTLQYYFMYRQIKDILNKKNYDNLSNTNIGELCGIEETDEHNEKEIKLTNTLERLKIKIKKPTLLGSRLTKDVKEEIKGLKRFMKFERKEIKALIYLLKKEYGVKSNTLSFLVWSNSIYARITDIIMRMLSNIEQEYLYVFFDEFKKLRERKDLTKYSLLDEIYITFYLILPKSLMLEFNFVESSDIQTPIPVTTDSELFKNRLFYDRMKAEKAETTEEETEEEIIKYINDSENNFEIDPKDEDLLNELNELYTN